MLEHHGLNRFMAKGITGYQPNVGLSVHVYNLSIIGNHFKEQEKQKEERYLQDMVQYRLNKQAKLIIAA